MYVAIVNPTVSGAAPRPDGYDWLRLLAYVRAQSQIGWVRVSDSESSRPYRISVNAQRVSLALPGRVIFSVAACRRQENAVMVSRQFLCHLPW